MLLGGWGGGAGCGHRVVGRLKRLGWSGWQAVTEAVAHPEAGSRRLSE